MKSIITVLLVSICFSLYAQEKTAKKLIPSEKINSKIRTAIKFQEENKALRDLVEAMKEKGFYPVKLKDWSNAYKNNITGNISVKEEIFVQIPKSHAWNGKNDPTKSESENIYFKNAIVTEIVLKQKTNSSMKSDIKIVQFIFEFEKEAKAALPKMKKVGAFTISVRGLKSPNRHWIYENTVYFCRVRAAAFSTKPFQETFEKKYGKVEVLRW